MPPHEIKYSALIIFLACMVLSSLGVAEPYPREEKLYFVLKLRRRVRGLLMTLTS